MDEMMDESMEDCIEECRNCAEICTETVYRCLELGGKHAERKHIAMLLNCASLCSTSARFMISGSEFHVLTCAACAEVCEACADDCEALGSEMHECAEACRSCAQICFEMAGGEEPKHGSPTDPELRA